MRLSDAEFLPIWQKAVDEFNKGEYFECHETLEAAWLICSDPDEKAFIQGIIQTAAALIKLRDKNKKGLKSTLGKLLPKLKMGKLLKPANKLLNIITLYEEMDSINHWLTEDLKDDSDVWPDASSIKITPP